MSKMAELEIEILDMLSKDQSPVYIARVLDIPVTWVYECVRYNADFDTEDYSPYTTINS
jgi:hypothetical protein